ncbi:ThiF family adenylyltransferase [Desulfovibrio oxyclinae]|uniref:ThiF family adenylyltransferase n=1 Tax=Desulfovibrio oxyclinae TaxID=63560 RepID=UPI000368F2D0|nr:ThiF family adenylyltransferase [Desulfovibrio oxyclinae]
MNREELLRKISGYGLKNREEFHAAAFARNLGLVNANELDRLMRSRVAVAGLGGVGGSHLMSMVRCGVGAFSIADMDEFNPVNVNRQYGASAASFGSEKLDTMVKIATDVNPHLDFRTFPEGVTTQNLDDFLDGADVVLDGLDFFVFDVRRMVFKRAQELGIPVITAGPMGFSSAVLVFMPGGMGFDEYFDISDETPVRDRLLKFAMGLSPRATHAGYIDLNAVDIDAERGPSSALACGLCSALASMEAMRVILGRKGVKTVPYYLQFDAYKRKLVRGRLFKGNRGALQKAKLWAFKKFLLSPRPTGNRPVASPPPDSGDGTVLDYLIRAGVRAPSGDNVQPWRFRKTPGRIDLFVDRDADHSFFNVAQTASLMSCGAVAENMTVAARACGRKLELEHFPYNDADCVYGMDLHHSDEPADDSFLDAIWLRTTNRRDYSSEPVSDGVWQAVAETLNGFSGLRLGWVNDRKGIETFAKSVMQLDMLRSENRSLHEHLVSMIRFTPQEERITRDGLPLKNLEAGKPGELFLRATKSWSVMRAANLLGTSRAVAAHSARGIRKSGGVGFISMAARSPENFLDAGRALQRVWLRFAHYGVQFQPAAAPALFRLRVLLEGESSFGSNRHQDILSRSWPLVEEVFPGFLASVPVMFFRVGFGPAIRHGTLRRPEESFLHT